MKPRSQTVGKFVVLACGMKAAWVLMPVVLLGDPLTKATGVRVPDADRPSRDVCAPVYSVRADKLFTLLPNVYCRQLSITARCS